MHKNPDTDMPTTVPTVTPGKQIDQSYLSAAQYIDVNINYNNTA